MTSQVQATEYKTFEHWEAYKAAKEFRKQIYKMFIIF